MSTGLWTYMLVFAALVGCIIFGFARLDSRMSNVEAIVTKIDARLEKSVSVDKANGWVDLLERDLRAQLGRFDLDLPRIRQ